MELQQLHNASYGSGRFCSKECARGFSTKLKRSEINSKVSQKLKEKPATGKPFKKEFDDRRHIFTDEDRNKAIKAKSCKKLNKYEFMSFEELPFIEKRRIIISEQKGKCKVCRISNWLGNNITLELHHVDGNNKNNTRKNLVIICPNCHSQTLNFRNRNRS